MPGQSNFLKTPLASSLLQLSGQRASDALMSLSKAMPCQVVSRQGQIVTVSVAMQQGGVGGPWTLKQLVVPIHTSLYDWVPFAKGDLGLLAPSDFYLGGVSGLGGGVADYGQRGNLSSLAFIPVANNGWTAPGGSGNDTFRVVQGPGGVLVQDLQSKSSVKLAPGVITITVQQGDQIQMKDAGSGASLHKVVVDGGTGKSRVLYAYDGG